MSDKAIMPPLYYMEIFKPAKEREAMDAYGHAIAAGSGFFPIAQTRSNSST